mmetsp:Transcript_65999/g.197202  ORF Transcript_65999/g.197202 Transcript_65999/m.197202 type:complete len:229 (-) Transcript_65999:89-775(-)
MRGIAFLNSAGSILPLPSASHSEKMSRIRCSLGARASINCSIGGRGSSGSTASTGSAFSSTPSCKSSGAGANRSSKSAKSGPHLQAKMTGNRHSVISLSWPAVCGIASWHADTTRSCVPKAAGCRAIAANAAFAPTPCASSAILQKRKWRCRLTCAIAARIISASVSPSESAANGCAPYVRTDQPASMRWRWSGSVHTWKWVRLPPLPVFVIGCVTIASLLAERRLPV